MLFVLKTNSLRSQHSHLAKHRDWTCNEEQALRRRWWSQWLCVRSVPSCVCFRIWVETSNVWRSAGSSQGPACVRGVVWSQKGWHWPGGALSPKDCQSRREWSVLAATSRHRLLCSRHRWWVRFHDAGLVQLSVLEFGWIKVGHLLPPPPPIMRVCTVGSVSYLSQFESVKVSKLSFFSLDFRSFRASSF